MVVEIEEVRSGMVVVVISINKQIADILTQKLFFLKPFRVEVKVEFLKKSELRLKPIFLFLQIGTGSRKVMTTGLFLASQPSKNAKPCSCLKCGFFCIVLVELHCFVINMPLLLDTMIQIEYMHAERQNFGKLKSAMEMSHVLRITAN